MEKKFDHLTQQSALRQWWQQQKIYTADPATTGARYAIDTPPPTVSGTLHIGHIFSYTQTDIIARHRRLCGDTVFYPFGFDDNGLATERFVEKKRGVTALQLGRTAFIKTCLEETAAAEAQFIDLWQAMGLSADWDNCYSTISTESRRVSQQSFIELYRKGQVYRKQEPALFCAACKTSVAQAELDDTEKPSIFYTLHFDTIGTHELTIATTRPELLPACVAVMYHPADERYNHLAGKQVTVPLFGHQVPLIADEAVKQDKGTGLVMCCTFGDTTDIEWYTTHKLPYRQTIGFNGKCTELAGPLSGLSVSQARARIVELLAERIVEKKDIRHAVNIHERCKQEIEYVVIPQWFVALLPHKEQFLALAQQITWYPDYMRVRYDDWVKNLNWDWCISRQRFFGIPFPVWHCTTCNHQILAEESQLPIDPQESPYAGPCPACGATTIVPDTDVMDTWNTSSLTPYLCKDIFQADDSFIPMAMRPQAHDIIRTWAFYTIVKSWMHEGKIPWRSIVISGHVITSDREKISKSQDNSPIKPENLLKNHPADVIRYWTGRAQLGTDTAFSDTQFKIGQKLMVKLWNACLFIKEHSSSPDGYAGLRFAQPSRSALNIWLTAQAQETHRAYQAAFAEHAFHAALEAVEKFFWHDFCDNYIELVKDQFFNPTAYDAETVTESKTTLYVTGLRVIQWLAPYMPFITETIYQELYQKEIGVSSLHITRFDDIQQELVTGPHATEASLTIELLLHLVAQTRKLKSDNTLSLRADMHALTIVCSPEQQTRLETQETMIKGVTRAHQIIYNRTGESGLMGDDTHRTATVTIL